MIVTKKPNTNQGSNWALGWRPGDMHVCKPLDLSTWTKMADVPPPPPGRVVYKCKGCPKTMVR